MIVVAIVIYIGGCYIAMKTDKQTAFLCGWIFAAATLTLFKLIGWMG